MIEWLLSIHVYIYIEKIYENPTYILWLQNFTIVTYKVWYVMWLYFAVISYLITANYPPQKYYFS